MMHEVQVALSRLVSKASQLIDKFTTNLAKNWMQVCCKFDGGKVINRSQSGSWEFHCYGAGLKQNIGKHWSPNTWKDVIESNPNQVFTNMTLSIARKADFDRKCKATDQSKENRRKPRMTTPLLQRARAYSQHDSEIQPDEITDVSPECLNSLKESFYTTNVKVTQEETDGIEHNTQQQSDNSDWMKKRT